jgi:hypothetical protein
MPLGPCSFKFHPVAKARPLPFVLSSKFPNFLSVSFESDFFGKNLYIFLEFLNFFSACREKLFKRRPRFSSSSTE